MNEDEVSEELQNRILLQPSEEREVARIKPNPNLKIQPVFVDPGPRKTAKENLKKCLSNGLCLDISGRIQHDNNEFNHFITDDRLGTSSNEKIPA